MAKTLVEQYIEQQLRIREKRGSASRRSETERPTQAPRKPESKFAGTSRAGLPKFKSSTVLSPMTDCIRCGAPAADYFDVSDGTGPYCSATCAERTRQGIPGERS